MYNTIKIKRRLAGSANATPPVIGPTGITQGELAYNEYNHVLYYGAEAGTMAIAGSGHFVTVGTEQTVSGNKTFTGLTTLGDTNYSANSDIDFGANRIKNIATPVDPTDVSTKAYVDDLSANAVDLYKNQTIAGEKTFNNNAFFKSNVTVDGDLTVLGAATKLETTTTVFSSFEVYNVGVTTGLKVTQTGSTDVAQFLDDSTTALIIKDGGNVGINEANPVEKLTVSGNISASGNIYARGDLYVQGKEIYLGNGNTDTVTIQPFSPTTDNDAANLVITGVQGLNNSSAEGSDINILGGDSFLDSGPGDRIGSGGEVLIRGGTGATGGNVEVRGGESDAASSDTTSDGGNVDIKGGVSTYGNGGNVTIVAGYGTTGTGAGTYFRTGVLNIGVAVDNTTSKTIQVSGDGRVFFPGAVVAQTEGSLLEGFVLDGGTF